jgi:hypothetical protein
MPLSNMMNNEKMDMTLEAALSWVNRAIEQDQKDIAISILKDLLNQAVKVAEEYEQLYLNK